jgi:hypothetical protein
MAKNPYWDGKVYRQVKIGDKTVAGTAKIHRSTEDDGPKEPDSMQSPLPSLQFGGATRDLK